MTSSITEFNITQDPNLKLLEEAFRRFNETGERLEGRYQALLLETEDLRKRLKEKEEQVKRSERLATLGQTAAAIAHEVRNPLGAMTLFLSLLRRDVVGMPSTVALVDQIEKSMGTLNHVVENILQFSRERPISFSPINLHAVVLEVVSCLKPRGGVTAMIECQVNGDPFILANEASMRQIIHNLLLNALQATRFEGLVSISVNDIDQEQVQIEVRDNGPGIPTDMLDSIFDPFVTTKNEGTGLGLAIVHRLVTQHHGSISLENSKGACFRIQLPRKQMKFDS